MSRISLKKYRVSIHALLAECDRPCQDVIHLPGCFNPRTPCGVRPRYFMDSVKIGLFQSTHSLRSATNVMLYFQCSHHGFNPRTPCGVRQMWQRDKWYELQVSIHALLAECDPFNYEELFPEPVSIHALLAECDQRSRQGRTPEKSFNPRTPCGVRRATSST